MELEDRDLALITKKQATSVRQRAEQLARDLSDLETNIGSLGRRLAGPIPATRKYCAPVGTEEERASGEIWPGAWVDATGYCVWYFGKWWHTGADLNLNSPKFDADAHAPVYSIAGGEVYAVRKLDGWEWVICIRHDECVSRYAHVEDIQVEEGQAVEVGQMLARIGNAGGRYPYHLHFDIARLDSRMARVPGDWPSGRLEPDEAKEAVLREYYDPAKFLRSMLDV